MYAKYIDMCVYVHVNMWVFRVGSLFLVFFLNRCKWIKVHAVVCTNLIHSIHSLGSCFSVHEVPTTTHSSNFLGLITKRFLRKLLQIVLSVPDQFPGTFCKSTWEQNAKQLSLYIVRLAGIYQRPGIQVPAGDSSPGFSLDPAGIPAQLSQIYTWLCTYMQVKQQDRKGKEPKPILTPEQNITQQALNR